MRPRLMLSDRILKVWAENPRLVDIDPDARRFFAFACHALLDELKRKGEQWTVIDVPLQYEVSA